MCQGRGVDIALYCRPITTRSSNLDAGLGRPRMEECRTDNCLTRREEISVGEGVCAGMWTVDR